MKIIPLHALIRRLDAAMQKTGIPNALDTSDYAEALQTVAYELEAATLIDKAENDILGVVPEVARSSGFLLAIDELAGGDNACRVRLVSKTQIHLTFLLMPQQTLLWNAPPQPAGQEFYGPKVLGLEVHTLSLTYNPPLYSRSQRKKHE
jgi:hypothetical protein